MEDNKDMYFLDMAVKLASENVISGNGGPFGAVIVRNNEVIATGTNLVTKNNDPTAHAEISAIRAATAKLKSFQIEDCTIYSSCEPCPMCLGAIYWARTKRLVFAATKFDAAEIGFDDAFIYSEIGLKVEHRKLSTTQILCKDHLLPFKLWKEIESKIEY